MNQELSKSKIRKTKGTKVQKWNEKKADPVKCRKNTHTHTNKIGVHNFKVDIKQTSRGEMVGCVCACVIIYFTRGFVHRLLLELSFSISLSLALLSSSLPMSPTVIGCAVLQPSVNYAHCCCCPHQLFYCHFFRSLFHSVYLFALA